MLWGFNYKNSLESNIFQFCCAIKDWILKICTKYKYNPNFMVLVSLFSFFEPRIHRNLNLILLGFKYISRQKGLVACGRIPILILEFLYLFFY